MVGASPTAAPHAAPRAAPRANAGARGWVTALRHVLIMKCVALALFALLALPMACTLGYVFNEVTHRYLQRQASPSPSLAAVGLDQVVDGVEGSPEQMLFAVSDLMTGSETPVLAMFCMVAFWRTGQRPTRSFYLVFAAAVGSLLLTPALILAGDGASIVPALYLLCTLIAIALSWQIHRQLGGVVPHLGATVVAFQLASLGSNATFLAFGMPAFLHGTSTQRVLLRVVMQPLMLELCLIPIRFQGYVAPDSVRVLLITYSVYPYFLINAYGRVMLANMGSGWATTIAVVGAGAIEVIMRLTVTKRDRLYMRLLRYRRGLEALKQTHKEVKAFVMDADQLSEDVGTLLAATLTILWRFSYDASPPSLWSVVSVALAQLGFELFLDVAPVAFAWGHKALYGGSGTSAVVPVPPTTPEALPSLFARRARMIRERVQLTGRLWSDLLADRTMVALQWIVVCCTTYTFIRLMYVPMRFLCPWSEDRGGAGGAFHQWGPCQ